MNEENFQETFNRFLAGVNEIVNGYNRKHGFAEKEIGFTEGRRYVRVTSKSTFGAGCSAFCFVDKKTGNVLKTASWNAPVPLPVGRRGNIYDVHNGLSWITPYGTEYKR